MKSVLVIVLLFIALCQPVFALDPNTVQGSFKVNGESIQLSKAYAHLHDNAEQALERPKELRILLADRVVPPSALVGLDSLPVQEMAKEGHLRGLLLRLDPNDRHSVQVTLLYPPAKPGYTLMTQTLSDTEKEVMKKLEVSAQSVTGEIEHDDQNGTASKDMPNLAYALQFSAHLSKEPPVTANLKGKAAENSPQVQVLREKARALAKSDYEAVRRLCTERANRRSETLRAQAGIRYNVFAEEAGGDLEASIRNIERVVVRGDHAAVIFADKEWANFVLEGKVWKSDD
jgi:hypothetical protein